MNYTGNAGLALGSSPDVTNVGVGDMAPLNQTARELALSSFEANKTMYAQKMADREKMNKLIQDEAFNAPILEQDRPMVEAARKNMLDSFYKNPDIMNNPQAYRDFTDKYTTAMQTAKQAQKRYVGVASDQEELKKATNPYDQAKVLDHIAANKQRSFWDMPGVYQPATHADMNVVAQPAAYGQEVKTRVGTDNVFTKNIDIPGTFENFQKAYLDPTKRDMFDKYIHGDSKYYGGLMNSEHAKPELDRLNGILVSRGIAPINEATDRTDQIAAKVAIANADPTLTRKEYATKEIKAGLDQQRLDETKWNDRAKAGIAGMKARAYVNNMRDKINSRQQSSQQDAVLDNAWKENIVAQPSLIESNPNGKGFYSKIQAQSSTPLFTFSGDKVTQLIPFGAKKEYSQYTTDENGNRVPAKNAKLLSVMGGHFVTEYVDKNSGKPMDNQSLADSYTTFKKNMPNWKGGFSDYLKEGVKADIFGARIRGENGATDEKLHAAALRAISNKDTKKGQVGVFDYEADTPPPDESSSESASTSSSDSSPDQTKE